MCYRRPKKYCIFWLIIPVLDKIIFEYCVMAHNQSPTINNTVGFRTSMIYVRSFVSRMLYPVATELDNHRYIIQNLLSLGFPSSY